MAISHLDDCYVCSAICIFVSNSHYLIKYYTMIVFVTTFVTSPWGQNLWIHTNFCHGIFVNLLIDYLIILIKIPKNNNNQPLINNMLVYFKTN